MVVRMFGKQMVKYQKPDQKEYWQMEDADENNLVAADIYKEDDFRVALNIYDRRKWVTSGGREKPELIYWMTLDEKNIKDFRLQVALKKLKSKTEKE